MYGWRSFRILILLMLLSVAGYAQQSRYLVQIELLQVYLSGICVLNDEGDITKGAVFNEFGVSTFSFEYQKDKERIKLTQIMPAMNRCYLKRQLKKDLKAIVKQLPGNVVYENKKYQLKYTFTPLSDETPE